MPNESNRRNLKALMDLLSDNHAEITAQAADVNSRVVMADERNAVKMGSGAVALSWASRQLETLEALLESQVSRTSRVLEEVKQIRGSLRV